MKMTSAYANKLLRQLNEEKEFLLNQEENSCTYVYAADEEPLIPQYSYPQTEAQLRALDAKIVKIKHAVNCSNVSTSLMLSSGRVLTVDQALVVMARLSQRKQQLDTLRKASAQGAQQRPLRPQRRDGVHLHQLRFSGCPQGV